MASEILSYWHGTSQKREQSESRHASRNRRAKSATENIIHNQQQHPRGESSQDVKPSKSWLIDQEAADVFLSKNNDAALLSAAEFANIIAESGRRLSIIIEKSRRELSTNVRLCRGCQSIVGWFFLDLRTWKRATAGHDHCVSIQVLSEDDLDAMCLLCSLLGNLIQKLRASDIADRDKSYQLSATTTAWLFEGSKAVNKHEEVPAFCVWPDGQPLLGPEIIKYNASFALSLGIASEGSQYLSRAIHARQIGPYADPTLVREWIAFCDAQHRRFNCHSPGDVSIPYFCVIDCNASPPCLVYADTRNSRGYITLSYVWGKDPCEGPDEYGCLPHRLPELIRGAIWVTLTLGYRYLWIDRYCVPQNDRIRKHTLVENMDKIYEGSALCIIAPSARSPKDGLHGITRPREVRQETIHLGLGSLSQIMTNIKEEVDNSHWNSRGWTYQESILARRRLIFTATQCCFQCGEQCFLETLAYLPQSKFDFRHTPHPFTERYDENDSLREFDLRAKEYSRRQLSKDSDAVPAITGILNRFRCFTHVSGVPVFHPTHSDTTLVEALLGGLTWIFGVNYSVVESYSWENFPRRRLGVPSWTWCAWECRATRYEPSWGSSSTSSGRMEFVALESIAVEDTEGRVLRWSGPTMEYMAQKLSRLSEIRFLRVCGWVCDVALPDGLQRHPPQNMSNRHSSIRYVDFGADLTRLQALARTRRIPRLDRHFMFLGWIVSIMDRSGGENFETWKMMLLSTAANGQDVERFDMCLVQFYTLPTLSPGTVSLSGRGPRGWSLRSFRIS